MSNNCPASERKSNFSVGINLGAVRLIALVLLVEFYDRSNIIVYVTCKVLVNQKKVIGSMDKVRGVPSYLQ